MKTKIDALKDALKADSRQADALRHLLSEYRRDKGSKTSYRKTLKALETLGIEGADEVLRELGYIDAKGKPYERYT